MAAIESILALILTISILVTFHEFGHYWVARRCGVKVLRFSVGFGKPLLTWRIKPVPAPPVPPGTVVRTRANEQLGTEFAIAAIPLGGYVKMLDTREGFVADDELHLSFNSKTPAQRIAIVLAGPIANFLLAIFAYWLLFLIGVTGIVPRLGSVDPASPAGQAGFTEGQEIIAVDGEPTTTWADVNLRLLQRIGDSGAISFQVREAEGGERSLGIRVNEWLSEQETPEPAEDLGLRLQAPEIPAVIGQIVEGGRAEAAGLLPGDRVREVDGAGISDWEQWVDIIRASPERPLLVRVDRGEESIELTLTPALDKQEGGERGVIGAAADAPEIPEDMRRTVRLGPLDAGTQAVAKTWEMSAFTLQSIGKMIQGAISSSNLSGPITIARIAGASVRSGLESFIHFIALLSVSLAVLNLLPIPVLDGGHFVYYSIELIAGRPVPERVQELGSQLGFIIIIGMMLLAFYNDLARF